MGCAPSNQIPHNKTFSVYNLIRNQFVTCLLSSQLKEKALENLSVISEQTTQVSWICSHLKRTAPRAKIALFILNLKVFNGNQRKTRTYGILKGHLVSSPRQIVSVLRAVLQVRWSKHAKKERLVGKSLLLKCLLLKQSIWLEKRQHMHADTHNYIQSLGSLPPFVSVHEKCLESCRHIQENNLCPSCAGTHRSDHYNLHKYKCKP